MKRVAGLLIAAGLAVFDARPANAGAEPVKPEELSCSQACIDAVTAHMRVFLEAKAPTLAAAAERFEPSQTAQQSSCPKRPETGPAVFGVMLAPGDVEGFVTLKGPENDVRLISQVMRDRGVSPDMVVGVSGAEATRSGMLAAMARPLSCLRERDQVVLVYSGWGTVYPYEWFDIGEFFSDFCRGDARPGHKEVCEVLKAETTPDYFLQTLTDIATAMARQWLQERQPLAAYLPGKQMHVLIGAGSRVSATGETLDRLEGITAADVSNFVTRIRNAGRMPSSSSTRGWRRRPIFWRCRRRRPRPAAGPSMATLCWRRAVFRRSRTRATPAPRCRCSAAGNMRCSMPRRPTAMPSNTSRAMIPSSLEPSCFAWRRPCGPERR